MLRRLFIPLIAGLSVLGMIALSSCATQGSGAPDGRKLSKIGVQLYTVRHAMEADFEGTLRRIAELGYDEVEFAGFFGRDPAEVGAFVNELGMEPVASHVNWKKLRENPQKEVDETVALGADYIILAWMPEEERQTLDQWRDWIKLMNKVGRMAAAKGLKFAYHNHDFEFEPIDGVVPYDLIVEGISRENVRLELDLYWVELAGVDPVPYFESFPNGFELSHVKDMSASSNDMEDVGYGRIDFAEIFAMSEQSGMKHFIVEHDNPEDPFRTLERSINYLRALEY